jgi:hypothetical protein
MSLVSMAVKFLDCVCRFGHFADGGEPVSNGNALPIAVILRFLFFATGNFAYHSIWIWNRLSSSAQCAMREMLAQFTGSERFPAF